MRTEIAQKMSMDQIRYSSVWEDCDLLSAGLNILHTDDILSITSAGCNVLSLLLEAPRSIMAVDSSLAQNALLELKVCAIEQLEYEDFMQLLGVMEGNPLAIYDRIRTKLKTYSRNFWDNNAEKMSFGVHSCGRLEKYFHKFFGGSIDHSLKKNIESWFDSVDLVEQRKKINVCLTADLKKYFVRYFDRENLAAEGRHEAQMAYVNSFSVGEELWHRFYEFINNRWIGDNFYFRRFVNGSYGDLCLAQPYLRKVNFNELKQLIGRLTIVTADLEEIVENNAHGHFNKGNFSDIFEYMHDDSAHEFFRRVADNFRPQGRIAYWNLLVNRHSNSSDGLNYLEELSSSLSQKDRNWFYDKFYVDEVL